MSTIKEIIDEFCDRINQPREATIATSSTPAARQFLSLYKFIGRELTANPNGWSQLKRTYTFTTATGVSNYQLPGDFDKLLIGTQWGVTSKVPLSGPISDAQMAFQTYGSVATSPFGSFQINGAQGYIFNTSPYAQKSQGYFQISPAGQNNTDQNVIAYFSSNFAWPRNWVASTAYVIGDIRTGINNMYICTSSGTSGATRPSVLTGSVIDGTVTWQVYTEPYVISNDSDFSLLDDDLMIEGLRWSWYRSKKQDYSQEKSDWDRSVRNAIGRQNGPCEINAGYNVNLNADWPNVPVGSWSI